MEKQLIANRIQTPDGTILWSRFTHDYVNYEDANGEHYFVDGGNNYCRTSVNETPAKPMHVYDDEPWEVQREYRLWGSSGMWLPVSKLSNEHIDNIINDGYRNEGVRLEQEYREKNNIFIPEHDYMKANECVKSIVTNG